LVHALGADRPSPSCVVFRLGGSIDAIGLDQSVSVSRNRITEHEVRMRVTSVVK
jgi:hypothetical protein